MFPLISKNVVSEIVDEIKGVGGRGNRSDWKIVKRKKGNKNPTIKTQDNGNFEIRRLRKKIRR